MTAQSAALLALMEKHKDVSLFVWIDVARLMGMRLKIEIVEERRA